MIITIEIEEDLEQKIEALARKQACSKDQIIHHAIFAYIQQLENRDKLATAAEQSWQKYRTTSKHLTGEELISWLETWGTDTEKSIPACHK